MNSQLFVWCREVLKKYKLNSEEESVIQIGGSADSHVQFSSLSANSNIIVEFIDGAWLLMDKNSSVNKNAEKFASIGSTEDGNSSVAVQEKQATGVSLSSTTTKVELDGEVLYLKVVEPVKSALYAFGKHDVVTIGGSSEINTVSLASLASLDGQVILREKSGVWELLPDEKLSRQMKVFNNHKELYKPTVLEDGDIFWVNGTEFVFKKNALQVWTHADEQVDTELVFIGEVGNLVYPDYPKYYRSPRIILREPDEKIKIEEPPAPPKSTTEGLAKIIVPPLTMLGVTLLTAYLRDRGPITILMSITTLVSLYFSVTSYYNKIREHKEAVHDRDVTYTNYLLTKTKQLEATVNEQRESRLYHFPEVNTLIPMAKSIDNRIYERTVFHHDFLHFRLGLGTMVPSFPIDFKEPEYTKKSDELLSEAKDLYGMYKLASGMPVSLDLMQGSIGYVGKRQLVLEQIQQMLMQVAYFHSYHDVQFITVFPEDEKEQWKWMRWLPHAKLTGLNLRGFVYNHRTRDQIMTSLYQILKERRQQLKEAKSSVQVKHLPHYVIVVADEKLIIDHSIMELFTENPKDLGVTLVTVEEVMDSLPEHVQAVIDVKNSSHGTIVLDKGLVSYTDFKPDAIPSETEKELFTRSLAPLDHTQVSNSIPETLTFLEMYGVRNIKQLNIESRWEKGAPHKTLAVPLGFRGKDDIVNLNLHEKAHGPHGLVAGTTGSGKSEIIQSYILSLAVNFHPYDVAFLLIDYKGGGMANLFKPLPHLVGAITNLDGAQSMRALISIKAELQRRQRVFSENNVNHINQYHKLFKSGEVKEPMPHLFLISDEFAELKAEQPEFMKELVSTARIGRSLGIHLILATQKPSGVVDDQIWSNSKFKLALKVADAADSNEMLKTPDAAEITLPGRAYLQVGNNEIYELFQSAWSGAQYLENKSDQIKQDATIYRINDLGQYEILSDDLSGLTDKSSSSKSQTELEAVIDHIEELFVEEPVPAPWQPPLPERIYAQEFHPLDYKEQWQKAKKPLIATLGLMDQPQIQAQNPLKINLSKDGHIVVYSSPGFGKSTFMQTMIMDLSRQNNPEQLIVYLLDFGTNGLLPVRDLPHVADTIMVDELEKVVKLTRILETEMSRRKKMLSVYGVASLEQYEQASGEVIPNILIALDGFDSIREAGFGEMFEKVITQIAREGSAIGIFLVMSAARAASLRTQLSSNIKNHISLFMVDPNEPKSIVGRTVLTIEETHGRGLVNQDGVYAFQAMLPATGEETLEQIETLRSETKEMSNNWTGKRPKKIPMVPEVVEYDEFVQENKELFEEGKIVFALDKDSAEPVELAIKQLGCTPVVSDDQDKVVEAMQSIVPLILETNKCDVILMDDSEHSLSKLSDKCFAYGTQGDSLIRIIENIQEMLEEREGKFKLSELSQPDFIKELQPIIVSIIDVAHSIGSLGINEQTKLAKIIEQGPKLGIYFIFGGHHNTINRGLDNVSVVLKKHKSGVLLCKTTDQTLLEVSDRIMREASLQKHEGYYIKKGKPQKIKLVKAKK